MLPGEAVYQAVVQHFGAGILNPDSSLNRAKLAELVFGSVHENQRSRIEELNHLVHPAVLERQLEWMNEIGRRDPHAIAIVEAALILEAGAEKQFDRLLVVTCRPEQRAERWAARAKVDEETAAREITRRMAAQFPEEKKVGAADYVIDNSGSLENTRRQVQAIYERLKREANWPH